MTTANQKAPPESAVEPSWYDLIDDPEPPEDAMRQASTIFNVMAILKARMSTIPLCSSRNRPTLSTTRTYPVRW